MKQENNDRWLEEIHDKMMDFEADAPADGWMKLESALSPKINYWKYIRRAVAAIVILLCGIGIAIYTSTPSAKQETTIVSQDSQLLGSKLNDFEQIDESSVTHDYEPVTQKSLMNFAATDNKIRTNKASQVAANEEQPKQNEDTDIVPNRQVNEMTDSSLADISEMTDSLYKNEEKRGNIEEKQLLALLDYAEKKSDKKANKKRSWSFGALFGSNGISGLSSINESNNGDASSSATVQPVDSVHNNDTKEMTRAGEFYLPQNSQSPILDAKNHRSWSFGVSVQKQLSTHLAIESGLVYTLLTSDIVIQANNNAKEVSQSLHYLGIPLKLNCLLANPRNWNFYVGVGAMLEYCVNGSRDGISLSMSDRWQWSAKANLGVQYNFSKLVGIYLEPGVNYFISPNKTIPTLRTQQPFSFNLNAGVRFNLK